MEKQIRVLQVVPNMNSGGIENLIMNIYRNIDRDKIQFDFLVHHKQKGYFDDEIINMGGQIYYFPVLDNKNIIKYIIDLSRFFKEHKEYKIVHGHMASLAYIYLGIARLNKVKVRIVHSHGTSHLNNLKGLCKFIMFKFAKYNANVFYACSTEAGRYLFGSKKSFELIPNAIDFKKFRYDEKNRKLIRNEFGISETEILIGHVGRFNLQKNHKYLIEVFKKLTAEPNKKYKLILVGIGELYDDISQLVDQLNLKDKVVFAGLRSDVNKIYSAMDIFVMPSFFEGLPLTGIEAQISGLPCILSNNITKETDISGNCDFVPLEKSTKLWENAIKQLNFEKINRDNVTIHNNNFDIRTLSKSMQNKYFELYNNIEKN